MSDYYITPSTPPKKSKTKLIVGLVIGGFVLLTLFAFCGGLIISNPSFQKGYKEGLGETSPKPSIAPSPSPTLVGFNDVNALATSVKETFTTNWADPSQASYDKSAKITSVSCVKADTASRKFSCLVTYTSDSTYNKETNLVATVTVSEDGNSWISE